MLPEGELLPKQREVVEAFISMPHSAYIIFSMEWGNGISPCSLAFLRDGV